MQQDKLALRSQTIDLFLLYHSCHLLSNIGFYFANIKEIFTGLSNFYTHITHRNKVSSEFLIDPLQVDLRNHYHQKFVTKLFWMFSVDKNYKQAEAEVVPSSSLVEDEVEVEVWG